MKKALICVSIAAAVMFGNVPALASSNCPGNSKGTCPVPSAKKPVSAICPVLGVKIPDVSKAPAKSVYKGKTYYFCCKACKEKFDKDPTKYLNKSKK